MWQNSGTALGEVWKAVSETGVSKGRGSEMGEVSKQAWVKPEEIAIAVDEGSERDKDWEEAKGGRDGAVDQDEEKTDRSLSRL